MERCDKDIRNYFVLETRVLPLPHQHSKLRPCGLTMMMRVPIHLARRSPFFCNMLVHCSCGQSFLEYLDNLHTASFLAGPAHGSFLEPDGRGEAHRDVRADDLGQVSGSVSGGRGEVRRDATTSCWGSVRVKATRTRERWYGSRLLRERAGRADSARAWSTTGCWSTTRCCSARAWS